MFPGSAGIVAAATGAGKSSLLLEAAYTGGAGIISLEDGADVLGSRILSRLSGVDSLKIRTKSFNTEEAGRLEGAMERLPEVEHVKVVYAVSPSLEEVMEAAKVLAEAGCRTIWLDYIQKVRGVTDDRRNEVSKVYTSFQRVCAEHDVVGLAVSQFSRQPDPTKPPQIWWLKESGDLENEARLIILLHRDPDDDKVLHGRVAKSTYGGENLKFSYRRDSSGLKYVDPETDFDGDDF
jgi:replicative DNA helicase